jgi:hypothetical protein
MGANWLSMALHGSRADLSGIGTISYGWLPAAASAFKRW